MSDIINNNVTFSKCHFASALKHWRHLHSLSQLELVEKLSSSHHAFLGVNQPMLSKWEHGNGLPSLMRRVGVATFFEQPYDYDEGEKKTVKAAAKYNTFFNGIEPVYPYEVERIEKYPWSGLTASLKEQILYAHHAYRQVELKELVLFLGIQDINVVVAFHKNAIMGHIAYGMDSHGTLCLLSNMGLTKDIYLQMHQRACRLFQGKKVIFNAKLPYFKSLMNDFYIEEKSQYKGISVYECHMDLLMLNPFFHCVFSDTSDFLSLCHYQKALKSKRTSYEATVPA